MNVFIAGGTSGIGYSLATHYLEKGYVGICGRDPEKVPNNSFKI
jgi:short-subunit dehydrogenase involved in D-alanine esterification of teichoic acids